MRYVSVQGRRWDKASVGVLALVGVIMSFLKLQQYCLAIRLEKMVSTE